MTINRQRLPIEFQNTCKCRVDTKLLQAAVLWYAAGKPQSRRKTIFMHGVYPGVSIFGDKVHVHRLLLLYTNRHKILAGLVSHHKDGDRLNAQIKNLELQDRGAHASYHNKGKVLSEKHKRAISKANRGRRGACMKKRVKIDFLELQAMLSLGISINMCAKHFKCDWSTIKSRIHENPELLNPPSTEDKAVI